MEEENTNEIDFSFGISLKRRTTYFENKVKELFDISHDDIKNIYFKNISEFTNQLCIYDKNDLSRSEAIIAYAILGSLVEAWLVLFLLFYSPEEDLKRALKINNKKDIPKINFSIMIDFITDNKNIECHENFFKNKKLFLYRIQKKRNYIHSISRDFNNFNNLCVDDHYKKFGKIFKKTKVSEDYAYLKVDIMSYDALMGIICNNIEVYAFNKHTDRSK